MTEIVEKQILRYCSENSALPILRLDYRDSMYKRLKTEAADEADLMVVIKDTVAEVAIVETGIPGYAILKALAAASTPSLHRSPYRSFCTWAEGYIIPSAIRSNWFRNLVQQAVFDFQRRFSNSPWKLSVVEHGPAVQLDVSFKQQEPMRIVGSSGSVHTTQKVLSVELVPCFHVLDRYYVPKQYKRFTPVLIGIFSGSVLLHCRCDIAIPQNLSVLSY